MRMAKKNNFEIDKSVGLIKIILSNMDDKTCGFHKLFKILYFAEKEHLSKYGRPITWDRYIAMKDGPVPSAIYDLLKILRGDAIFYADVDLSNDFEVQGSHYLHLLNDNIDMDIFSESELECIQHSIEENKNLTYGILRDKSHDQAWKRSQKDDSMSIFEIAKAGGANDDVIKYINVYLENKNLNLK